MSATITRKVDISIDPTAVELAEVFWEMTSFQQAEFFNRLGYAAGVRLCFQLQAVTDEAVLNKDGRDAMRLIGEYSEESQS